MKFLGVTISILFFLRGKNMANSSHFLPWKRAPAPLSCRPVCDSPASQNRRPDVEGKMNKSLANHPLNSAFLSSPNFCKTWSGSSPNQKNPKMTRTQIWLIAANHWKGILGPAVLRCQSLSEGILVKCSTTPGIPMLLKQGHSRQKDVGISGAVFQATAQELNHQGWPSVLVPKD